MRNLKQTLLRMAERAFTVAVLAGLARVVLGGEITVEAFAAMVAAVAMVTGLLIAAHRLK